MVACLGFQNQQADIINKIYRLTFIQDPLIIKGFQN